MHKILFLSILFLFVACEKDSSKVDETLAKFGNRTLFLSDAIEQISPDVLEQDRKKALEDFKNKWLEQQIILREAARLDLEKTEVVQKRLARLKENIISQALFEHLKEVKKSELWVTDEEARSYFQINKSQFVLPERYVQYRHMEASSLANAETARKQLLGGIPWETVNERFNQNPSLKLLKSEEFTPISNSGDGIPQLNRYLELIGLSEISPIIRVGESYHFVQLTGQRAKGELPELEWLLDQIKEWLYLEKSTRLYNSYLNNLYLQAKANNEIQTFELTTD